MPRNRNQTDETGETPPEEQTPTEQATDQEQEASSEPQEAETGGFMSHDDVAPLESPPALVIPTGYHHAGTWKGRDNWQCDRCRYSTLREDVMKEHVVAHSAADAVKAPRPLIYGPKGETL